MKAMPIKLPNISVPSAIPVEDAIQTVTHLVRSWDKRKNIIQLVDKAMIIISAFSNEKKLNYFFEMLQSPYKDVRNFARHQIDHMNKSESKEISKVVDTLCSMHGGAR